MSPLVSLRRPRLEGRHRDVVFVPSELLLPRRAPPHDVRSAVALRLLMLDEARLHFLKVFLCEGRLCLQNDGGQMRSGGAVALNEDCSELDEAVQIVRARRAARRHQPRGDGEALGGVCSRTQILRLKIFRLRDKVDEEPRKPDQGSVASTQIKCTTSPSITTTPHNTSTAEATIGSSHETSLAPPERALWLKPEVGKLQRLKKRIPRQMWRRTSSESSSDSGWGTLAWICSMAPSNSDPNCAIWKGIEQERGGERAQRGRDASERMVVGLLQRLRVDPDVP